MWWIYPSLGWYISYSHATDVEVEDFDDADAS